LNAVLVLVINKKRTTNEHYIFWSMEGTYAQ
jgi:hypothetical protein